MSLQLMQSVSLAVFLALFIFKYTLGNERWTSFKFQQ